MGGIALLGSKPSLRAAAGRLLWQLHAALDTLVAMVPGLVSITFRAKSPAEVIGLASRAGLRCIEWGGDVHVPPGDTAVASAVRDGTRDAGMSCAAYGSYYRCTGESFAPILTSAVTLGVPQIRVWAGQKGSAEATPEYRKLVTNSLRAICAQAADRGQRIVTEWHGGTLTDTLASTQALFADVDHPNLFTYWQPRTRMSASHSLEELGKLDLPIAGVHVFSWDETTSERLALAAGRATWQRYLGELARRVNAQTPAMLEFVKDDSDESLVADAAELMTWQGMGGRNMSRIAADD